ncbi:MAG: class I SAM-dependent methyltransferase [Candidatus Sulfotelmatobacter sp.]
MSKALSLAMIFVICLSSFGQSAAPGEFISFQAAQPSLKAMGDALPPDLKAAGPLDADRWSKWVQAQDLAIRQRLDRGTEDTLTNLLRFGVTFTKEYRIDDEYLVRYGQSSLVNAFAENRANDLIKALAAPKPPERMIEMRAFLEKQGLSLKTPQQRALVKKYLLDNLARMRDDFLKYRAQTKDERRFQLFQDRGISLDTNLWPDYQLDLHFRGMIEKGLLTPGSVHRVAIVGPGLDFANKEAGSDFYPPQTTQPFAVLDSLVRLGIADAEKIEIYTLDISQDVNLHLDHARKNAASGHPYVVQLAWNTARPMSAEYRKNFIDYWQQLGNKIGIPVEPIPVPSSVEALRSRAVKIPPKIVQKITPLDINIVYQRLALPPEQAFDLVIGTNIFVYYGEFEQSLARANVAAMLKPGGYLISNDKLPDTVPSGLNDVLDTPVVSSVEPLVRDVVFCYRRAK